MAEKINITFLGTASAIPTARRNHTAMLLRYKDQTILFDCGEGTQRQFRKAHISMSKITKILISHWHADHCLGLPGLLQSMAMNGYNRKLEIYGPHGSKNKVQELITLFGIDRNSFQLEVHEVKDKVFIDNEDFCIEASSMDHGAATNAYSFSVKERTRLDKDKLLKLKLPNSPLIGQLSQGKTVEINGKKIDGKKLIFQEDAKKITFIVDTRFNENAVSLSKDSDLVICESSYSCEEKELAKDHAHMTSDQAATIAKKSKSKRLALIHLSQRYDAIPKKILAEAKETFKETFVPEDLDSVEI